MGKYIIEIPDDKVGDFVGSTHFLMPYMMAGHIGHHDTGLPIKPYTEPDLGAIRNEAYEKGVQDTKQHWIDAPRTCAYKLGYENGLNDAWDAARKIWDYDLDTLKEIFGKAFMRMDIYKLSTASEAIEKIRQYEQRREEIHLGDEVATDAGNRASVLYEDPDGTQVFVFKSDGTAAWWTKSALHRTGRHFPEIAAVLEKMREEE